MPDVSSFHPADADWFSHDAFWEAAYPVMFAPERFAAAEGELDAVLALVGGAPKRVVDVACGPGRHAIEAARRGMTVTGIDRSAFLLGKARERAGDAEVAWVHGDMRDPLAADSADLVLNLFTSFGYFEDDADNQAVIANAFRGLADGGALVVDVAGKEVLARIFLPDSVDDLPDGILVQRRRVAADWSRMDNEWTFVEDGRARTFRLGHWIYSARELTTMLHEAGFETVDLYGDFQGAPYGPEASRLVAVARKASCA